MLRATLRDMLLGIGALALPASCSASPPVLTEAPATVYLLASSAPARPADTFDEPPRLPPAAPSEWHVLSRSGAMRAALREAASRAVDRRLLPVLFVGRTDCEPCKAVKHHRYDPRMQVALRGTAVLEVDLGVWGAAELSSLSMSPHAIPAFYVLDARGRSTGQMITGGAWGDDIPENMAPPLSEFFSGARR
jgi:hypothetical protein